MIKLTNKPGGNRPGLLAKTTEGRTFGLTPNAKNMAQLSKTDQDSIKRMAASRKVSDEQAPSTSNNNPLPPQPYWFERNGVKVFGFEESDVVAAPEGKTYSMIDTVRGELVCQLKPKEVTTWLIRNNGLK